jgi:ABC-type glycerol-3-phosphate transport system substrate-binding protein
MVKTADLIREMTGIRVTLQIEQQAPAWIKRQAEFAAGQTSNDIMDQAQQFLVAGGLRGMYVDLNDLIRRDKWDTRQFYKDLAAWAWTGKQWGLPSPSSSASRWARTACTT